MDLSFGEILVVVPARSARHTRVEVSSHQQHVRVWHAWCVSVTLRESQFEAGNALCFC